MAEKNTQEHNEINGNMLVGMYHTEGQPEIEPNPSFYLHVAMFIANVRPSEIGSGKPQITPDFKSLPKA